MHDDGVIIIQEADKRILSICGPAYDVRVENSRIANYIISAELSSGVLYYSNLTGELIWFPDLSVAFQYMVSHWIIIPKSINELNFIDGIIKVQKFLKPVAKQFKTYEISTTTHCNANCFYCYERRYVGKKNMEQKVAFDVADFIYKTCADATILKWFGGEPLLNTQAIDIITNRISLLGVSFSSQIVTNGYLFDSFMISKAADLWHLKRATITIDGTERIYNKTKAFQGVSNNPFYKVIDNIDVLTKFGIKVSIRINIDYFNVNNIANLIKYLCDRYNPDIIDFRFQLLIDTFPEESIDSRRKRPLYDAIINIMNDTIQYGYKVINSLPKGFDGSNCPADKGNHIEIDPNGNLSHCLTDSHLSFIGTIYDYGCVEALQSFVGTHIEAPHLPLCVSCPMYIRCIPSHGCSFIHGKIKCNEDRKMFIITEQQLAMRQLFKETIIKRNNETKSSI